MTTNQQIEIVLRRSPITTTPNQRENLHGLGLRYREQRVLRADTPSIRGMIRKVLHLVEVRKMDKASAQTAPKAMKTQVEIIPGSAPVAEEPKKKAVAKKVAATKKKGKKA